MAGKRRRVKVVVQYLKHNFVPHFTKIVKFYTAYEASDLNRGMI